MSKGEENRKGDPCRNRGVPINSDLNIIPVGLRALSISDREVVLPFNETLRVLEHWGESGNACLGWEAWVLLPDGRKTGFVTLKGTPEVWSATVERNPDEPWQQYVKRSIDFCHTTIIDTQNQWERQSDKAGRELYYCLTPERSTAPGK